MSELFLLFQDPESINESCRTMWHGPSNSQWAMISSSKKVDQVPISNWLLERWTYQKWYLESGMISAHLWVSSWTYHRDSRTMSESSENHSPIARLAIYFLLIGVPIPSKLKIKAVQISFDSIQKEGIPAFCWEELDIWSKIQLYSISWAVDQLLILLSVPWLRVESYYSFIIVMVLLIFTHIKLRFSTLSAIVL